MTVRLREERDMRRRNETAQRQKRVEMMRDGGKDETTEAEMLSAVVLTLDDLQVWNDRGTEAPYENESNFVCWFLKVGGWKGRWKKEESLVVEVEVVRQKEGRERAYECTCLQSCQGKHEGARARADMYDSREQVRHLPEDVFVKEITGRWGN